MEIFMKNNTHKQSYTKIFIIFLFVAISQIYAMNQNQGYEEINDVVRKAEITSSSKIIGPWSETIAGKIAIVLPSALMALNIFTSAAQNFDSASLLLGGVIGFLLADATTGFSHWAGDKYTDSDKPIENQALHTRLLAELLPAAYGHHQNPQRITEMSYWEKSKGWYLLLPATLVVATLVGGWTGYTLAVYAVTGAQSEFLHSLAHTQHDNNFFVKALQKSGLILNSARHKIHHYGDEFNEPYTTNFCLIQGTIIDPFINKIAKWLKWLQ